MISSQVTSESTSVATVELDGIQGHKYCNVKVIDDIIGVIDCIIGILGGVILLYIYIL